MNTQLPSKQSIVSNSSYKNDAKFCDKGHAAVQPELSQILDRDVFEPQYP